MNNRIFLILFLVISTISYSQINELGIHVGGSNYIGDVGRETYIYPNDLSYGVIYKWNANPRLAFRLSASYIKIKDDDADSSNEMRNIRNYSFRNSVKEAAIGIEFNYYNYSLIKKEWSSTPYIIVEMAVFNYNAVTEQTAGRKFATEQKTGFTIPFGIGYKTKLAENIGIGIETKIRYTFKDNLDYNNTKIPVLSFGNPDSNDWYVTTGINIVFGFGRRGCYSGAF